MKLTPILTVLAVIAVFQAPKGFHAHQQGIRGAEAVCEVLQRGGGKAEVLRVVERFTYAKHMAPLAEASFKDTIKDCQRPAY